MSDVTIIYKGSTIATMDDSGTKTLLTDGKLCEDDIEVVYVKPSGGSELSLIVGLSPNFMNTSLSEPISTLRVTRDPDALGWNGGRLVQFALDLAGKAEHFILDYSGNAANATINCNDSVRGDSYATLKRITINLGTAKISNFDRIFYGNDSNASDIVVDGTPLDFSRMSSWNNTISMRGIKEIRFEPNTLGVSSSLASSTYQTFSDDTWVSFANCLFENAAATLTLGSAGQTTLAGIMGTVASGVFTKDSGGSTSLSDFITQTKGWTLA